MPKLIKTLRTNLVEPLTLLFNRSFKLGQVLSQWKMANVSAIFKGKGSEQEPSNYRAISIISCIGKMLELLFFFVLFFFNICITICKKIKF